MLLLYTYIYILLNYGFIYSFKYLVGCLMYLLICLSIYLFISLCVHLFLVLMYVFF